MIHIEFPVSPKYANVLLKVDAILSPVNSVVLIDQIFSEPIND